MRILITLALLLWALTGYSAPKVDPDHALIIGSVIGDGNLMPLAKRLMEMADKKEGHVDLVINSPGGEVTTGFIFISVLERAKEKGLTVRCFVPMFAASMAFSILTHCDERYALDRSFLLWHRARTYVGGIFASPMTSVDAEQLATELGKLDRIILDEVLSTVGKEMPEAEVKYHFEAQTLHVGSDLAHKSPGFLTSYKTIDGLLEALGNGKILRTATRGLGIYKFIYVSPYTLSIPTEQ